MTDNIRVIEPGTETSRDQISAILALAMTADSARADAGTGAPESLAWLDYHKASEALLAEVLAARDLLEHLGNAGAPS
jgi:hypothetical protein